eukprot:Pgem_evm2s16882
MITKAIKIEVHNFGSKSTWLEDMLGFMDTTTEVITCPIIIKYTAPTPKHCNITITSIEYEKFGIAALATALKEAGPFSL